MNGNGARLVVILSFFVLWLLSAAAVVFVLVKLPADYFLTKKESSSNPQALGRFAWIERYPLLRLPLRIAKNILGLICVILGVVMLVTPGQGILTLLIGLLLLDVPGKRELATRIASRPRILATMNTLRARYKKPPFEFDTSTLRTGD